MAISFVLRGWVRTPQKPIFLLNCNAYGDKRRRCYTGEEVARVREFYRRWAYSDYIRIFHKDGPQNRFPWRLTLDLGKIRRTQALLPLPENYREN
jgi:hypothetical protein